MSIMTDARCARQPSASSRDPIDRSDQTPAAKSAPYGCRIAYSVLWSLVGVSFDRGPDSSGVHRGRTTFDEGGGRVTRITGIERGVDALAYAHGRVRVRQSAESFPLSVGHQEYTSAQRTRRRFPALSSFLPRILIGQTLGLAGAAREV